eukprot:gene16621-25489_t
MIVAKLRRQLGGSGGSKTVGLADYSCSQGKNTAGLIEQVVAAVPGVRYNLFLTDLPGNDWANVRDEFSGRAYVRAVLPSTGHFADPASISAAMRETGSDDQPAPEQGRIVTVYLCGRSIFDGETLPRGAVAVGFSGSTMHWLSKKAECDAVFVFAGDEAFRRAPAEARKGYEAIAEEDWKANLSARSNELSDEGCLVLVVPCFSETHAIPHPYPSACRAIVSHLERELSAGQLTRAEASACVIACFHRSEQQLKLPFVQAPGGVFRSLALSSFDIAALPNPYYKPDGSFVDVYIQSILAWGQPSWHSALGGGSRAEAVIEGMMGAVQQAIAEDPSKFTTDYLLAYMTIRKQKQGSS